VEDLEFDKETAHLKFDFSQLKGGPAFEAMMNSPTKVKADSALN
jgi:hypothetical protein